MVLSAAIALTSLACENQERPDILQISTSDESASSCDETMSGSDDSSVDSKSDTFSVKLMEILSNDEYSDCITWLPKGRSFFICNREKFAEMVLPKHFPGCKLSSFTKQLNRWNFQRIKKGPEIGAYYHEFFQRDKPSLCINMRCKYRGKKSSPSPKKVASKKVLSRTHVYSRNSDPSQNAQCKLGQMSSKYLFHDPQLSTSKCLLCSSSPLTISIIKAAERVLQRSEVLSM